MSGVAVGLNKGHTVTKREVTRQARKRGQASLKTKNVRSLIREVAGFSPYEKRLLDMIKVYGSGADKKLYKTAKKRLGTHKRAIAKREEMKEVNMRMKAAAAQ